MTFIIAKGGLEESSFWGCEFFCPPGHSSDARAARVFPLGPVGPNGPTNSYSPRWRIPGPGGNGNKGSDCALWGFLPSYLAI